MAIISGVHCICPFNQLVAVRSCSAFLGAARSCSELLGTVRNCSELLETNRNCSLFGTARKYSELLGAARNCSELLGAARSCFGSTLALVKPWANGISNVTLRGYLTHPLPAAPPLLYLTGYLTLPPPPPTPLLIPAVAGPSLHLRPVQG